MTLSHILRHYSYIQVRTKKPEKLTITTELQKLVSMETIHFPVLLCWYELTSSPNIAIFMNFCSEFGFELYNATVHISNDWNLGPFAFPVSFCH